MLFKRTQIRGMCPSCHSPLVFIVPVWGMVIRWAFLLFNLYMLYTAADMGVHLWSVWHPANGEKVAAPSFVTLFGCLVLLAMWIPGAMAGGVLLYLSRPRLLKGLSDGKSTRDNSQPSFTDSSVRKEGYDDK
ncbi:TPA: hypothetical protein G8L55_004507 [Salmonella enterica]|uniref:Uncharacterized protein n=5 Tax=Salmonella enterica TaxID=28901 RepID=I3W480_SALER|nr:hypothetical protein [Salmonella enterica]AFK90407.1 hypothetical protein [Salmonella enterica subsp. salamae]EAA4188444.1 hypothetical protein [Salmonella enterica subsp. enterica serovar Mikawasima]EAB7504870.1 hypothetical protein [Salmonella enterica subsp. enterica]EAC0381178.1 hypothetical protein [Salmonella enterica subsp. enterica serovar Potsdam]EBQ9893732.1 hypothetical protein [Salmonella enterica subsp. enterica serovar Hvittingfoss]EBR8658008.1 hypothetical protein [Salmonell